MRFGRIQKLGDAYVIIAYKKNEIDNCIDQYIDYISINEKGEEQIITTFKTEDAAREAMSKRKIREERS